MESNRDSSPQEKISSEVSPSQTSHHAVHQSTVLPNPPEAWKKGGRLLSALLIINVALLGCALISSGAFHNIAVQDTEVHSFLTILMLLTIFWMLFYMFVTSKHQTFMYKDHHAGPIWLRGGLALFGLCSLVLDAFKIVAYIGYFHCESPVKIVFLVVQAMFVIIQTYFLWVSSKDCIQIHLNLSRYGLMLALTTNLSLWMAAITDESIHQTHIMIEEEQPQKNHTELGNFTRALAFRSIAGGGGSTNGCECSISGCTIFTDGYYYLYPFNIEYSLFASALSYVMWKNVGRFLHHQDHHPKLNFRLQTLFVGVILGITSIVTGLGIFIVYEVQINAKINTDRAVSIFYIFNIVCLSLMSFAALGGSIIHRFDKRSMDNHKNPTRTLDVALLLGAALGQYCISYYSIVAIVGSNPKEVLNILGITNSLLMIVQHTLQNVFIIEGLHKEPAETVHQEHRNTHHFTGLFYTNENLSGNVSDSNTSLNKRIYGQELTANKDATSLVINSRNAKWRRKILKEIALFLLLCNIIFWIMPAFGARPHFDNHTELKFYGTSMWVAIVNICLPFGIFYRMHSVASLLEVYIMS
uniref:Proton channel OTOP2 n=1 Tax=Geotrypetes seraphini TaxID=260995 RepID=A0A6P8SQT0_GEOSA|nr:proton channel OTOP2 [Geotrypetes seraphini]XP_033817279.1 proton channel OTOP2 [Geotrypetes seraphini]XP_033817280.1 proton channel OTOP2 [Geotrypetes seraphini]XP_033817281.1 proton channel OTOP2 [Geotrypetes seraphini]